MKTVIAIVAVGAVFAAVPAMAADGIQPGLWKITTTVLNNGAQMPPQTKPDPHAMRPRRGWTRRLNTQVNEHAAEPDSAGFALQQSFLEINVR